MTTDTHYIIISTFFVFLFDYILLSILNVYAACSERRGQTAACEVIYGVIRGLCLGVWEFKSLGVV